MLKPLSITLLTAFATLTAGCAMNNSAPAKPQPSDTAARAADVDSFLDQYARTYRFRLGKPTAFKLTPKGDAVLFLRSPNRSFVQDLYSFDIATGQERILLTAQEILGAGDEQLSAEEKARRERMRMAAKGIASFDLSKDGSTIITSLSGRLFLIDRATRKVTEVISTNPSPAIDPSLSPDGKLLAHCRGRDLCITHLATNEERVIAKSDSPHLTYGQAEFVAQEEMSRFRGYWFSPDSKTILYQGFDTADMETFHIADPTKPENEPDSWPYPRAGKKNAQVWLEIAQSNGSTSDAPLIVTWDATNYPYLAHVKWAKQESGPGTLVILVQNREQTAEQLLKVDPKTGATTVLLQETDAAWVELEDENPTFLKDGSFLWVTERNGGKQIEHRNADGSLKNALNQTDFGLQRLVHVDEDSRKVYVQASSNPTRTELFTLALDGIGAPSILACGDGRFSLAVSEDSSLFLETQTLLREDTTWNVRKGAFATKIGSIKSVTEKPIIDPKPTIQMVKGEREYWTAVILPQNFDSKKKYPVIAEVYAGPTALTVNASKWDYTRHQWLANQGFIVISIDNRGTNNRGREWSRAIKGNFIDAALEDQVDGLKALAKIYPQMDLARVGVSGWSFGGYFAAMAVLRRPDIYSCGIAGAPVTDWHDYDTHYTERYMGLPEKNAAGYDASSCMTYASNLSRPLLLIHGTSDDNVYFMHSLKLSEALFRAGKEFDFLPLSGFTHMVPDPVVTINLQQHMLNFLKKNLNPGSN